MLSQFESELFKFNENLDDLYGLAAFIEKAVREDAPPVINEGGMIKTGYCKELDELIKIGRDGKGWIARLEVQEKDATSINSLKIRYNKVFGYYIEVPKTHSKSVPSRYVRKQTLVNAERYITEELKNFEQQVLGAEDRRAALEYEIFTEIRGEVTKHNRLIQDVAQFIAGLDCLLNLAEVADLTTSAELIRFSHTDLVQSRNVQVLSTIRNIGGKDAENVIVQFAVRYDSDPNTYYAFGEDIVASIPANGAAEADTILQRVEDNHDCRASA